MFSFVLTRRARIALCTTSKCARKAARWFLILLILGLQLVTLTWFAASAAMAVLPAAQGTLHYACDERSTSAVLFV